MLLWIPLAQVTTRRLARFNTRQGGVLPHPRFQRLWAPSLPPRPHWRTLRPSGAMAIAPKWADGLDSLWLSKSGGRETTERGCSMVGAILRRGATAVALVAAVTLSVVASVSPAL